MVYAAIGWISLGMRLIGEIDHPNVVRNAFAVLAKFLHEDAEKYDNEYAQKSANSHPQGSVEATPTIGFTTLWTERRRDGDAELASRTGFDLGPIHL